MKKIIVLAVTAVMAAGMMVSCGKFTCDACGEEKSGKKYKEEILGIEMTVCENCHDLAERGMEALADMFD